MNQNKLKVKIFYKKYERTSVRILGIMNITFAALLNLQTV